MQHNILRAEECGAAARSLLEPSSTNCCVTLVTKSDVVQQTFPDAVAKIKQHLVKTMLIQEEDLYSLVFANWTAMSLFQCQHDLKSASLTGRHRGCGPTQFSRSCADANALVPQRAHPQKHFRSAAKY